MNDKKLTKSATNRMISGVCGGIGEYFHLDATLIRLIWAILTVGGVGSGLILYIIAAIVIPEP
ncbi:MAG: PspC domain-containing protein [Lachnospiraceae bacterium]|jgi:phage shock protein C|nr:PspC domain-containing protein [Lachnospiraceae bacterium]MDE7059017.1 PspC domain-containing protein [Lachnospiraceae bacterium]